MVRKRTRTSRKHYESDDNDSDSDYELEDPGSHTAPKKYSLRQRKKALFIDDYDYEDDDEILPIPPTNAASDDEDFEVERELEYTEDSSAQYVEASTYNNHIEDPSEDPNALIDFEDIIRADIVVNRNRIDYDNMINKTEIKLQANEEPTPVRSKRGRKPKKRPGNEVDSTLLELGTEVNEEYDDKDDVDYNPAEEVEPQMDDMQRSEPAISVGESEQEDFVGETRVHVEPRKNPENTEDQPKLPPPSQEDEDLPNDSPDTTNSSNTFTNSQESVIKFIHNNSTYVNCKLSSTEPSDFSESKGDPLENPLEDDDDDEDDDVVFVEDKRSEIIVLDD